MNLRALLARTMRRSPIGSFLHAYWPTRSRLFEGGTHLMPRRTARILKNWRALPDQVLEGERVLQAYQGGDFIDVGAFQGAYQLLLSPRATEGDRFVACEPDARAFPILLTNLAFAAQQYRSVRYTALPDAVGEGDSVNISFPAGEEGHPQFLNSGATGKSIVSVSIDQLTQALSLHPRLIKIDVEGAEFSVLRGAHRTLEKFHPAIMLEIHSHMLPAGVSPAEIKQFLTDLGYIEHEINFSHGLWQAESR